MQNLGTSNKNQESTDDQIVYNVRGKREDLNVEI